MTSHQWRTAAKAAGISVAQAKERTSIVVARLSGCWSKYDVRFSTLTTADPNAPHEAFILTTIRSWCDYPVSCVKIDGIGS